MSPTTPVRTGISVGTNGSHGHNADRYRIPVWQKYTRGAKIQNVAAEEQTWHGRCLDGLAARVARPQHAERYYMILKLSSDSIYVEAHDTKNIMRYDMYRTGRYF